MKSVKRTFPKAILVAISNGKAPDGYVIEDEGDWVDYGSNELRETVFKHQDKFYQLQEWRQGSYITGYRYDHESWPEELEVQEVKLEVITVSEWQWVYE